MGKAIRKIRRSTVQRKKKTVGRRYMSPRREEGLCLEKTERSSFLV